MITLKDKSEAYRLAVLGGFLSPSEVVSWADSVIASEASPDPALIHISTSASQWSAIVSALNRVTGECNPSIVSKLIFGLMLKVIKQDPSKIALIAKALEQMAIDKQFPDTNAESEMLRFDDALTLAKAGTYGSVEEVQKELSQFLEKTALKELA